MLIKKKSIFGKQVELDLPVTPQQIKDWEDGQLIQNVMPHLSADQREFLISGIMPGDWDKLMRKIN